MTTGGVDALLAEARAFVGVPPEAARTAAEPVNPAMIHHWCEALEDANPAYAGPAAGRDTAIAPPAMLGSWTLDASRLAGSGPRASVPQRGTEGPAGGQAAPDGGGSRLGDVLRRLEAAGFTAVVATAYEQEHLRELGTGDHLSESLTVESITDRKETALGEGVFVTVRHDYTDAAGALVGIARMTLLKFTPTRTGETEGAPTRSPGLRSTAAGRAEGAPPARSARGKAIAASTEQRRSEHPLSSPPRGGRGDGGVGGSRETWPRPAVTADTAFFWEGVEAGELRIQRCTACGRLRHPPHPLCPACQSTAWDHVVASGRGSVHSHATHHHPPLPGIPLPHTLLLVDLEEGVRLVSALADPGPVTIGDPVVVAFTEVEPGYVLPLFRPVPA